MALLKKNALHWVNSENVVNREMLGSESQIGKRKGEMVFHSLGILINHLVRFCEGLYFGPIMQKVVKLHDNFAKLQKLS